MSSDGQVRFDGRVAVITGAGRGLGREFAHLLARRGASVVVNDIGVSADSDRYANSVIAGKDLGVDAFETKVAHQVAAEITELGGRAVANTRDIVDPANAASIVDDAVREFGRVDIVINNAGVVIPKPFEELTFDVLTLSHRVHVLGSFNVLKAAWPHLAEQRYGRVVNICSVEGPLIGDPGFEAYASAKGGLTGMMLALALHGGPHGIAVNGLIPSANTRASLAGKKKRLVELPRDPVLIAAPVTWLCHEGCDVTGQLFAATSGSMRRVFTSIGPGYRSPDPASLSLEELSDNWESACSREGAVAPSDLAEFAAFWNGDDGSPT